MLEGVLAVGRLDDLVALVLEERAQGHPDGGLVFDYQNARHRQSEDRPRRKSANTPIAGAHVFVA